MKQISAKELANLESLIHNKSAMQNMHPLEIAKILDRIRHDYEERFYEHLEGLPKEVIGDVLLQLPEKNRNEVLEQLNTGTLKIALEELESDDATDLLQEIEEVDEQKAKILLDRLDKVSREEIRQLKAYGEDEAGAFMQTEVFDANVHEKADDAIKRFRRLREEGELENIQQVFIIDDNEKLIAGIWLETLICYDFTLTFEEIIEKTEGRNLNHITIDEHLEAREVVQMFEQYDVSDLPVIDDEGTLLGRITSDDVYDMIEESATEQLYNLAGVDEETESEEDIIEVGKKRASWLFVNLLTAILASVVIGLFEETIESFVALAILMPIVASMGGNAGTQTLTVVVRQMALGNIEYKYARSTVRKEVLVSLINGGIFAGVMGTVSYFWFGSAMLGVVIGAAMIINLFAAGFFGASIPLLLKKLDIDPAIGSTVILTTVTDVLGFFCFLGLASWVLL